MELLNRELFQGVYDSFSAEQKKAYLGCMTQLAGLNFKEAESVLYELMSKIKICAVVTV